MSNIHDLNRILQSFKLDAICISSNSSKYYKYYDIKLNHTPINKLKKFTKEIGLAIQAEGEPNFSVIYNEGVVRLELLSQRNQVLNLLDYFSNDYTSSISFPILLGETMYGKKLWIDLAKAPHILLAGTTGSGKSCLIHNIIANVYQYNHNTKLYLIDPKNIEFSTYDKYVSSNIRIGYTMQDALMILNLLISEMENRYNILRSMPNANMPYVVCIIDEFGDLFIQDKDNQLTKLICRLAQKSRAARIHLILATQRPSTKIISGDIKANFPTRIACRTVSHIDSRIILDQNGAEKLLGKGDALISNNEYTMQRFQTAYVSSEDIINTFHR